MWAWQFGRPTIRQVDGLDAWDEAVEHGRYAPFALLDDFGRVVRGTDPDEYEAKLRQAVLEQAPRVRFWYTDGLRGTAETPVSYRWNHSYTTLCEQWEMLIQLMENEEEDALREYSANKEEV
jgi:hypothetical protein